MADGYIEGNNIICGVHGWDYRYDTGVSEYNNEEALHKFSTLVENGIVYMDETEINDFLKKFGHHGPTSAMGVDRNLLPKWEDIQFLPAQLARKPLLDHDEFWSAFAGSKDCLIQRG